MSENTKKSRGPRFEGFEGFAVELVEAPTGPREPVERSTTNGACEVEREPLAVREPVELPVGSVAVREVLGFPAGLLSKVPAPWALHCAHDGVSFVVTNSRACYGDARDAGVPVLLGGEWYALAHAAQNDRAWSRQLASWIGRKTRAAEWRLTHAGAFDGMPVGNALDLVWSVGEVLERIEATLERVEVRT